MASLLDYGGGAYKGLEDIMAEQLRQQIEARAQAQLQEQIRSNRADEGLRGRTIDESSALRRDTLTAAGEEKQRVESNRQRDDARANIGLIPPGSRMKTAEIADYEQKGIPSQLFNMDQLQRTDQGSFEGPMDATAPFVGTASQQQAQDRITQAEDRLREAQTHNETNENLSQMRLELAQAIQAMHEKWGPPLVPTQGPNGTVINTPRPDAAGKQAPLPSPERQQIHSLDTLDAMIVDAVKQGDESGWAGIGPVAGRVGPMLHETFGVDLMGEGDKGILNRSLIEKLRTEASFARGGQQLTPTEREALDTFIATSTQDPHTAVLKLKQFLATNKQRRDILLPGNAGAGAAPAGPKRTRYDMNGNVIPE